MGREPATGPDQSLRTRSGRGGKMVRAARYSAAERTPGSGTPRWQNGTVPMRQDCKNFESRTYPGRRDRQEVQPRPGAEAPWRCPDPCPGYERRLADVNWAHGTLVTPPTPAEPPGLDADDDRVARLLDEAEEIVNAAGPELSSPRWRRSGAATSPSGDASSAAIAPPELASRRRPDQCRDDVARTRDGVAILVPSRAISPILVGEIPGRSVIPPCHHSASTSPPGCPGPSRCGSGAWPRPNASTALPWPSPTTTSWRYSRIAGDPERYVPATGAAAPRAAPAGTAPARAAALRAGAALRADRHRRRGAGPPGRRPCGSAVAVRRGDDLAGDDRGDALAPRRERAVVAARPRRRVRAGATRSSSVT